MKYDAIKMKQRQNNKIEEKHDEREKGRFKNTTRRTQMKNEI